ncbi:DUF3040 domain-containing protein [Lentzea sp. JNUCC 0626]|uniref:DUF3040 domain-containing protein n=1 Tax=Lentzea sp. JNUCC 0626 TaxID=3367513 RepID=UPI00374A508B
MNRREQRALRAIEKNIKLDDPELAEKLRTFGDDKSTRRKWYAAATAVVLMLIGANAGSPVLLLTGLVIVLILGLKWTFQVMK